MSTLSQNTIQTEALKAPAPQVGQSTGPVGFKSGLSVSTTAILALIEALMKISDLKNDLFSEQVTAETKMAQAYSQGQEQIGEQEMFDYIGQAVSGFVSGALNLGMGLKGMFEESKLQPLQEKINGATSYQKLINDRTPAEQIVCEVPEQEDIELQNQAPLVRNEENEDMVQNRFKEMLSKEEFTTGEGENTK
ncbi:MAG: hypothetical protein KDK60_01790, partial [Chlamydiia bacterium]|nr:hypothetical protein [Chlamydiia bacterium]